MTDLGVPDPLLITEDNPDVGLFGGELDIDGDTLVVAEYSSQRLPGATVHVFVREAVGWVEQALLAPPAGGEGEFGSAVAISGDTLVVGAPKRTVDGFQSGVAHIYARNGSSWHHVRELRSPEPEGKEKFAQAVDIDGDTIVIGARKHDSEGFIGGAAVVYVRSANGWTVQRMLANPDARRDDRFGEAVAVEGDTVLIGAPKAAGDKSNTAGAVYAYERTESTWALTDRFTAPREGRLSAFGSTLDLDGDTVAIGDDYFGPYQDGRAYVFARSGTDWTAQAVLRAPDGIEDSAFGNALALLGDELLVSVASADVGGVEYAGAVYRYTREDRVWSSAGLLLQPAGDTDLYRFGHELASDGDTVAITSSDRNEPRTGEVWVYER